MKRIVAAVISLFLVVFIVGGSLAGGECCNSTCYGSYDCSGSSASPSLGTVFSCTAAGVRWSIHASGHALCACQKLLYRGIGYTVAGMSAAANWTDDAIQNLSSEVTSPSLKVLHSGLSSFLALVSGLMHS